MFKNKKKISLLLDLGTDTLKSLIFQFNDPKIKILNFEEEKIQRYSIFNGESFELDIIRRPLKKITKKFDNKKEFSKIPTHLFFTPHLLRAEILNLSFKRKLKDEKIDKEENKQIQEFILNKSREELFKKQGVEIEILKKEILIKKIDGYRVSSFLNLNGKNLTFKVLVVFTTKQNFNFIQKIKESLNFKDLKIFHPIEPLINFTKRQFFNEEVFIFIDIGEKNTLIYFFKNKEIEFVSNFNFGGFEFTQELSKILNLKKERAEILKEDFSLKRLSLETEKRLEKILQPILKSWLENLKKEVKQSFNLSFWPTTYLFGGGSLLPLIKEGLNKELKIKRVKFLLPNELPIENQSKIKFSTKETSSLLKIFI